MIAQTSTSLFVSPLGPLLLTAEDEALTSIRFLADDAPAPPGPGRDDAVLCAARDELGAYFAGELRDFSVPLAPRGTPFQQRVWQLLREIPYGQRTSYGALAQRLGRPGAARAVGLANNRNPLPILIPCHRVVAADGGLCGYAGGLHVKQALLELESR